jgi:hypothetical protein
VTVVTRSGMPEPGVEIVHFPAAVNVTTPFDSTGLPSISVAVTFHSPSRNFSSSFTALSGSSPDDESAQSETATTQGNRRVIIGRTSLGGTRAGHDPGRLRVRRNSRWSKGECDETR